MENVVIVFLLANFYYVNGGPNPQDKPATTSAPATAESSTEYQYEYVGPIRKCPNGNDAQLNACFKLILADLKPKLAAGIPEIQLPPLDPLLLEKLDFKSGKGAVVIKAEFTDVKIKGLSNFTKAEFIMDRTKRVMNFEMLIPRVRIDGTYNLGGNILVFPIGGTGPYWFDIAKVQVRGQLELKLVKKSDSNMMVVTVDKIHLDLEIGDIQIQLLNLFNGNQVLGPVINNVLNENGQELFQEIKPGVVTQISGIVSSIANAVLANLSFLGKYIQ
jgi:hypothetical protein